MSKKSPNTSDFKTLLNAANVNVPKQRVDPVEEPQKVSSGQTSLFPELDTKDSKKRTKDNEVQLNVHVDAMLLKRLKLKGVNENKNIKQMINEALTKYLK